MTNERNVWLVVRIFGLLALVNSLRFVFIIMENSLLVTTTEMRTVSFSQTSGLPVGWLIEGIVYFCIGLYLLLNGKLLFDLLNRAPDNDSRLDVGNEETSG